MRKTTPNLTPQLAADLEQLRSDLAQLRSDTAPGVRGRGASEDVSRRLGRFVLQLQDRKVPLSAILRMLPGLQRKTLERHAQRELARYEEAPGKAPKAPTPKAAPQKSETIKVTYHGAVIECPSVEAAAALLRGLA